MIFHTVAFYLCLTLSVMFVAVCLYSLQRAFKFHLYSAGKTYMDNFWLFLAIASLAILLTGGFAQELWGGEFK